jgi:hypothetical protein
MGYLGQILSGGLCATLKKAYTKAIRKGVEMHASKHDWKHVILMHAML